MENIATVAVEKVGHNAEGIRFDATVVGCRNRASHNDVLFRRPRPLRRVYRGSGRCLVAAAFAGVRRMPVGDVGLIGRDASSSPEGIREARRYREGVFAVGSIILSMLAGMTEADETAKNTISSQIEFGSLEFVLVLRVGAILGRLFGIHDAVDRLIE